MSDLVAILVVTQDVIAVAMSPMVAATLSPRPTICPVGSRKLDGARVDDRAAIGGLPLEHVGPEPKDVAQLCVAETSEIDKKSGTSARSNSYQQSKPILALSGAWLGARC
jgi:hypothetical protein